MMMMNIIECSKIFGFNVIKHLHLDQFLILQLLASQVDKQTLLNTAGHLE